MSGKKRNLFGVSNIVFILILLGMIGTLFDPVIALVILVPIVGYYVWDLRQKNKDLEARVNALEGHPTKPKSDQA